MSDQFPAPGGVPPVPQAPEYPSASQPVFGAAPAAPAPQAPVGAPAPPVPQAPPGAYQVPVGGYAAQVGSYRAPDLTPAPSRRTGTVALLLAIVAAVVAPILGAVFGFQVGLKVDANDVIFASGDVNFAALTPVRTEVLWIEIVFWAATALGLTGLVLGIVAIAQRRGRALGIFALILAALGPVGYFLLTSVMFGIGNGVSFA